MSLFRHKNKNRTLGFTLVELSIGAALLAVLGGMIMHWFSMQRKYQQRITQSSEGQQNILMANWKMSNELRMSRSILYPRPNSDKSIKSDTMIYFKNSCGDIICYFHDKNTLEIKRCVIPNGVSAPTVDKKPIAQGINEVFFTAVGVENRLIDIYTRSLESYGLESIYLIND
ncbi:type II secretion system protein [bacterium]|nr:type II secretion system protein [bacterium]